MDTTAWTVVGAAVALLAAICASFRSLRGEMRHLHARIGAQGEDLRRRLDAHGEQMGQLRERMAHLEGLLEGLRDAVAGKRVA